MLTKTNRRRFTRNFASAALATVSPLPIANAKEKQHRIRKVDVLPTAVEFRSAFNIGVGKVGGEDLPGKHVFVRVETEEGQVGWGATNTIPNWSYETVEAVTATLRHHLAPLALGKTPFELNALKKEMDVTIRPAVSNGAPFAKSALEIAFLDVAGKIMKQPLHVLLGGKIHNTIDLCFAVGIAEPKVMADEVKRWPACTCFKVKVSGDTDKDLERLEAISDARPDADIWLDANQSYQAIELGRFFTALRQFKNIRCFEQPVRSEDWLGMGRARESSPYPIAIDEGCFSSFDVARMAQLNAADLVVLKVSKSAGVTNCMKSAAVAEATGLGLLGSGLTDAGVSFMAAIHLYSTMDLLLPPELNGPQFLKHMMVEDIAMEGATVKVPDRPGLGVTVSEDRILANQLKLI